MTLLESVIFLIAALAVVGGVFFWGGRAWERAGVLVHTLTDDAAADAIVSWVRQVGEDAPPAPLALAPPPAALPPPPPPPATNLPPGPVRSYSALAAWQLEQDTTQGRDTSVTKLTASIVRGMAYRDQIDQTAAVILAQARASLASLREEQAA